MIFEKKINVYLWKWNVYVWKCFFFERLIFRNFLVKEPRKTVEKKTFTKLIYNYNFDLYNQNFLSITDIDKCEP